MKNPLFFLAGSLLPTIGLGQSLPATPSCPLKYILEELDDGSSECVKTTFSNIVLRCEDRRAKLNAENMCLLTPISKYNCADPEFPDLKFRECVKRTVVDVQPTCLGTAFSVNEDSAKCERLLETVPRHKCKNGFKASRDGQCYRKIKTKLVGENEECLDGYAPSRGGCVRFQQSLPEPSCRRGFELTFSESSPEDVANLQCEKVVRGKPKNQCPAGFRLAKKGHCESMDFEKAILECADEDFQVVGEKCVRIEEFNPFCSPVSDFLGDIGGSSEGSTDPDVDAQVTINPVDQFSEEEDESAPEQEEAVNQDEAFEFIEDQFVSESNPQASQENSTKDQAALNGGKAIRGNFFIQNGEKCRCPLGTFLNKAANKCEKRAFAIPKYRCANPNINPALGRCSVEKLSAVLQCSDPEDELVVEEDETFCLKTQVERPSLLCANPLSIISYGEGILLPIGKSGIALDDDLQIAEDNIISGEGSIAEETNGGEVNDDVPIIARRLEANYNMKLLKKRQPKNTPLCLSPIYQKELACESGELRGSNCIQYEVTESEPTCLFGARYDNDRNVCTKIVQRHPLLRCPSPFKRTLDLEGELKCVLQTKQPATLICPNQDLPQDDGKCVPIVVEPLISCRKNFQLNDEGLCEKVTTKNPSYSCPPAFMLEGIECIPSE